MPRKPSEQEFSELVDLQLATLKQIRRENGHCSYAEGDLDFMLRNASIAVFDKFNPTPAPHQYTGKLMIVVWGLREVTHYVWLKGRLVEVSEDNRAEVR